MRIHWADWLAVGLAVSGAAAWLARRAWVNRQRQKAAKDRACSSGCSGCPFANGCGSKAE